MNLTPIIHQQENMVAYIVRNGVYEKTIGGFVSYHVKKTFQDAELTIYIYKHDPSHEFYSVDISFQRYPFIENMRVPSAHLYRDFGEDCFEYICDVMGLSPGEKLRDEFYEDIYMYDSVSYEVLEEFIRLLRIKHPDLFS